MRTHVTLQTHAARALACTTWTHAHGARHTTHHAHHTPHTHTALTHHPRHTAPPPSDTPNSCDERYGPTWQVIVGEDFKVAFTHDTKHFMFVEAGKQSVLVWR